jgi:hypothetical protein
MFANLGKKSAAKKADTNIQDFMESKPSSEVQKTINEGKLKKNEFLIDG